MKRNLTKIIPTGMVITLAAMAQAQEPAPLPVVPPITPDPAASMQPPLTPLPAVTGDPAAALGAAPTPAPFNAGTIFGSSPAAVMTTPPPLAAIGPESSTPGTSVSAPIAVNNFEFLFREDAKEGVVRERVSKEIAKEIRDKEIDRIIEANRRSLPAGQLVMNPYAMQTGMNDPSLIGMDPLMQGDPLAQGGMMAGNPAAQRTVTAETERATAEWDFYYNQLERYSKYVKEKLLPLEAADLPDSSFTASSTDDVLNDRKSIKDAYDQAAVAATNREYMKNRDFYERLQVREDRRSAYYEWLSLEQRKLEEWTTLWSRKTNGTRWTSDDEIRRDDWYYGTNFNSEGPVKITVDNRKYLLSRTPQANLAPGELNVISNNLTPYDIIDANGEMKNRVMEIQRGTIVVPPTPSTSVGTIEIAP